MSVVVAAVAASARCPGRLRGHPEGVPRAAAPSPPRHFTFEPLPPPPGPSRPRRRHRRVLYPPAVRRPLPSEDPGAAKRVLLLLLAVVGAQILTAPGDADGASGAPLGARTALGTPPGTPPGPEGPQIPAGNSSGASGAAPGGGSCPALAPPAGARGT